MAAILIAFFFVFVATAHAPLPNRLERANLPTPDDFLRQFESLLQQITRFLQRNDLLTRPGPESEDCVTGTGHQISHDLQDEIRAFYNRLQMFIVQLERMRGHVEAHEQALSQLSNNALTILTDLRRLMGSQQSSTSATTTSDSVGGAQPTIHSTMSQTSSTMRTPMTVCPRGSTGKPGAPSYKITAEQLESLMAKGFKPTEIAKKRLLGTHCRQTVYNHLKKQKIPLRRSRYSNIDEGTLERRVREIHQTCPNAGQGEVMARLRCDNVIVQERRIRQAVRTVDPVGTASRWSAVIQRRRYSVRSANSLWHLDTNHALRRWGFVINGGIDGFSRLVVFLRASTNNAASTSHDYFMTAIKEYGIPSRIRTDKGGEYESVRAAMERLQGEGRGSAIQGRSVHNSRVERLWRDVTAKVGVKYYRLFYYMEDSGILDVNDCIHMFVLQFVYLPRISADLDSFRAAHNNHRVRTEHNQTPNQLWTASAIQGVNQTDNSAIINMFYRELTGSIENVSSEPSGSSDSNDNSDISSQNIVLLAPVPNPLSENQFQLLVSQFDPSAPSDSEGIDIYGEVLSFVLTVLSREASE